MNFLTPREAGQIPLQEFPWTIELLHKADVTMTGVNEGRLAGRMKRATGLGGENAGKERKAGNRATEDGQKICAFPCGRELLMTRTDYVTTYIRTSLGGLSGRAEDEGRC